MVYSFSFDKKYSGFGAGDTSVSISDGEFVSQIMNGSFISNFSDEFVSFDEYYRHTIKWLQSLAIEHNYQKVDIPDLTFNKYLDGEDITEDVQENYNEIRMSFEEEYKEIKEDILNFDYKKYNEVVDFVLLSDNSGLTTCEKLYVYDRLPEKDDFDCSIQPQEIAFYCQPVDVFDNFESPFIYTLKQMRSNLLPKEYFKSNRKPVEIKQEYYFDDFETLFKYVLIMMIKENKSLKKCSNCNKYFYPEKRSDAIYCDNVSPQDINLSCKEYGSKKLWYDKVKNSETAKLYRNIYATKQMRVRRNPNIEYYAKEFEDFKQISKQWKNELKKGTKSNKEYLEWLYSVK